MTIRELRVTDIRCRLCGAPPGEWCRMNFANVHPPVHHMRESEHAELVEAGYLWREVDPTDKGAGR